MMLKGQVAVVTGAASGIGLAIARELAAHGGSVAVADIAGERPTPPPRRSLRMAAGPSVSPPT